MAELNKLKRAKLTKILFKILDYKNLDLREFLKENGKLHWFYSDKLGKNRAYYNQLLDLIFSFNTSATMSIIDEKGTVIKEISSNNSEELSQLFANCVRCLILARFEHLVFFLREIGYNKNEVRHLLNSSKTSLDYNMIFAEKLGYKVKASVQLKEPSSNT